MKENAAISKQCIGFVHSPAHEELWTPCERQVTEKGPYCREHRDGLIGALLGFDEVEELFHALCDSRDEFSHRGQAT
ncbi:MAG: hypothetical protein WCD27_11440, partial [Candidatus Acidiferrales bacterium]